jgi:3-hydroxybutyryl-CoA dehydrogenase
MSFARRPRAPGPLDVRSGAGAVADLIGLDTIKAIAESMYAEFKEPLYSPPSLLSRMVDAGLLGQKTGRGFNHYGE